MADEHSSQQAEAVDLSAAIDPSTAIDQFADFCPNLPV